MPRSRCFLNIHNQGKNSDRLCFVVILWTQTLLLEFPTVTIIVPTFGRPKQLEQCLRAISCLAYPTSKYEVLVVDDGSDYGVDHVVRPFKAHFNVEYTVQPHRGPAATRNYGGRIASGAIIAFTDDDCRPDTGWLTAIVESMSKNNGALLGGRIENCLVDNLYSRASQLVIDYLYEYYSANNSAMRYFCANNMACERDLFMEIGGFSHEFPGAAAEDRDLCRRWIASDRLVHYCPDALVLHAHSLTLKRFWRQHFNYGKGSYIFHERSARASGGEMRVERLDFYGRLVSFPWQSPMEDQPALGLLMTCSQIATASGFAFEFVRSLTSRDLSHEFSQTVSKVESSQLTPSIRSDRLAEIARN